MRVVLYARVSTKSQADAGLSLTDQLNRMRDFCEQYGLQVAREFIEGGASGTTANRKEFRELRKYVGAGTNSIRAVIVYDTSRFFRSVKEDLEIRAEFAAHGVKVLCARTDDPRRLLRADDDDDEDYEFDSTDIVIRALCAQEESKRGRRDTRRAMQENARQGHWNGAPPPYGFQVVKEMQHGHARSRLEIHPDEAAIVRRIFGLYVSQGLGAKAIAAILNGDGLRYRQTRLDKEPVPWSQRHILQIVGSEACIGRYQYNKYDAHKKRLRSEKKWIALELPPLIDEGTFALAQQIRTKRTIEGTSENGNNEAMLLTGILRCGCCGAQMVSTTTHKKTASGVRKYRYYLCKNRLASGKSICTGQRIPMEQFEKAVLSHVGDWAFDTKHVQALLAALRKALLEREVPLADLRKEFAEVEARLKRYYDAFEQGAMSPSDVAARLAELNQQKKSVESKILQRSTVQELPAHWSNPAHIGKVRDALTRILREGEHRTKRRYLSLLLESIAVQGEEVTLTARNDAILAMLEHGENLQDKPGEELCLGVRNGSP